MPASPGGTRRSTSSTGAPASSTSAPPTARSSTASASRPRTCTTAAPSPSAAAGSRSGSGSGDRRAMSELTLTLLRLGFLARLWLLVLSILGVLRRDVFGTRIERRTPRSASGAPAAGAAQPVVRRSRQAGQPPPPADAGGPQPVVRRSRQAEPRPSLRTLVVTEGSLRGTTLSLGQAPVLIGRAPESTLVLEDDYASARHARIYPQDGEWFAEDLGSTNGTFIGPNRLTQPTRLEAGVPVRVGRTVLELRR